jgi:cell division protein ZapA
LAETQSRSAAEISRAQLAAQDAGAVVVEIYDQVYQLRGPDSAYIERLAALAALNIADELTTLRARFDSLSSGVTPAQPNVSSRAGSLSGMLDALLEDDRRHSHLDRKAG